MPPTTPEAHKRWAPVIWHSLHWRLPITISVLIAVVLATFLWAAYREVEATLLRAGGERAQGVVSQLASLLERSAQQSADEVRRLAADPDIVRYFEAPGGETRKAAEKRLAARTGAAPRRVTLFDQAGSRTFDLMLPGPSDPEAILPPIEKPPQPGLGRFQNAGDIVYADGVGEVMSAAPEARRLGHLVVRSAIRVNPPNILERLVGPDASIAVGNITGDVWTDFSNRVSGPAVDATAPGIKEYRAADGSRRLGAIAHIRPTPWTVWVEFPRALVIAPARTFLNRMLLTGMMVILVAAALVRVLTGRLTTPLTELTAAAESIAGGDYTRRVNINRADEVGRLAASFNTMGTEVEDGRARLEAQVQQRSEALEALQRSEAHYRAIVELAFDCVMTIDAAGRILEFNPAAERTFGHRRKDVLGKELALVIVPPKLRAAHREGVEQFAATGRRRMPGTLFETTAMRANGAEFPVELAIGTIPSGGPPVITAVARDITQRKQVERALLESERSYRSTFDEAPVGIAHTTLDGHWLRVNLRLADLLGFSRTELLATEPGDLTLPEASERDAEIRGSLISGDVDRHVSPRRYRRKNGEPVWVTRTISLHRDTGGGPLYFIEIIEDISERRSLEEQLRQAQKMEAVGRLAGGVAHDFNNILTAILGYASFVLEDLDAGHPARRDIEEIQKAGESAASLTRQLLAFSRRQVLQPQIVDLNAIVKRIDALLRRLIGEDIARSSNLAVPLAPVNVDPGQAEQIILNLAVNARDAMSRGGLLTIETANVQLDESYVAAHPGASTGPHVMLAITDTGAGMTAETMSHLFEPFFTTKPRGEGTGLGLATVYGIVSQSGGSIDVSSQPGLGSTFRVYLPVAAREALRQAEPPVRSAPVGGGETILIAEDQPEVRALARKVLGRHGYTVLEARSGDEALDIVSKSREPIHLLLTDVVMPAMSGRELAARLHETHPEIRILYASGYTDEDMARHGLVDVPFAFIHKPFTPQSLLMKIREVLDGPSSERTISEEHW